MTDSYRYSDELLNAYVDGELDFEEQKHIEQAMRDDDRVRERVDEIKGLKQLVRSAYIDEVPERESSGMPRTRITAGLAASAAAFALGVAVTWGVFSYTEQATETRVASVEGQSEYGAMENGQDVKAIFHVSRNDAGHLNDVLTEAEALLATTARRGTTASVRIIASGNGLMLFENRSTPEIERIADMKREYQGHLFFTGCGLAYKQLKKQRADGEFELLPEMRLVDLGVLELMRRQRQGWAYIRL